MLRIEFHEVAKVVTIRIEGRFVGKVAQDAKDLIAGCTVTSRLVVNLSEVTFVDAIGGEVLSWLGRIGAEFVADKEYSIEVCERLHLPSARRYANSSS